MQRVSLVDWVCGAFCGTATRAFRLGWGNPRIISYALSAASCFACGARVLIGARVCRALSQLADQQRRLENLHRPSIFNSALSLSLQPKQQHGNTTVFAGSFRSPAVEYLDPPESHTAYFELLLPNRTSYQVAQPSGATDARPSDSEFTVAQTHAGARAASLPLVVHFAATRDHGYRRHHHDDDDNARSRLIS